MSAQPEQLLDWPRRLANLAASSRDPRLATFYRAGCPAADCPLEQLPMVALDIETTGLDPKRHAIVSLGLVPFDLQRIRCSQSWYQVVRPSTSLHPESIAFHRITHSEIEQAPPLKAVLSELLERLAGKLVVVHYRPIERGFLDQALRRELGEGWQFPLIDTMAIEAELHPQRQPGWLLRLLGKQPISIRLADSRSRYALPLYQSHHALTDAIATAELFQAQIATHFDPQLPVSRLWC